MRRRVLILFVAASVLAAAAPASASELIDRNAHSIQLAVNARGQALLTYTARGSFHRVVASGAMNARYPNPHLAQVQFHKDYSGHTWLSIGTGCRRYDGPSIAFFVTGCAALDGSYWAVQSWRRTLPNSSGRLLRPAI